MNEDDTVGQSIGTFLWMRKIILTNLLVLFYEPGISCWPIYWYISMNKKDTVGQSIGTLLWTRNIMFTNLLVHFYEQERYRCQRKQRNRAKWIKEDHKEDRKSILGREQRIICFFSSNCTFPGLSCFLLSTEEKRRRKKTE